MIIRPIVKYRLLFFARKGSNISFNGNLKYLTIRVVDVAISAALIKKR